MIAIVHPSRIAGTLCAPRSKSDMQRACAAALLHQGVTHIVDPGKSNDDLAALEPCLEPQSDMAMTSRRYALFHSNLRASGNLLKNFLYQAFGLHVKFLIAVSSSPSPIFSSS